MAKAIQGTLIPDLIGVHFAPGREQVFKEIVSRNRKKLGLRIFEVENEEKESGFPDTLEIMMLKGSTDIEKPGLSTMRLAAFLFVEYKVSDYKGNIDLRPRQPMFYRRHADLPIVVRIWVVPEQAGYEFQATDIADASAIKAKEAASPLRLKFIEGRLA